MRYGHFKLFVSSSLRLPCPGASAVGAVGGLQGVAAAAAEAAVDDDDGPLVRGERPDEGGEPADHGPAQEEIEQEHAQEAAFVVGDEGGQEIEQRQGGEGQHRGRSLSRVYAGAGEVFTDNLKFLFSRSSGLRRGSPGGASKPQPGAKTGVAERRSVVKGRGRHRACRPPGPWGPLASAALTNLDAPCKTDRSVQLSQDCDNFSPLTRNTGQTRRASRGWVKNSRAKRLEAALRWLSAGGLTDAVGQILLDGRVAGGRALRPGAVGAGAGAEQNALSSAPQNRTFQFDLLGRMTSETNPESGVTRYSWDSNCGTTYPGDLVTRFDANGNAVCYQYDALHRVTQIAKQSGPDAGLIRTLIYDTDHNSPPPGAAPANIAGRLVEAATGGAAPATDRWFSYDSMGRTAGTWEQTPHSGGWYNTAATYYLNGAINQLDPGSSGPPNVPTVTYGLDSVGRISTATGSWGPPLASAVAYRPGGTVAGVTFGSGDSDSYQYDPNTGRVTNYTFDVGGQSNSGTLTWNPDGTLGELALTDNIPGTGTTQNCAYEHDDLGRIAGVTCTQGQTTVWQQTFTLDPFGNVAKSGNQSFGASYVAANGGNTNRIVSNVDFAPNYDADGNLLDDPITGAANGFDVTGDAVVFQGATVVYDALGRAVEFTSAGATQEYLYGPGGGKLAVMNGAALDYALVPLPGGGDAEYT